MGIFSLNAQIVIRNYGMRRIKEKVKEWKCRLFHKKEHIELIHLPLVPTLLNLCGCKKCDLWRVIE
jgi:hypothetical protein